MCGKREKLEKVKMIEKVGESEKRGKIERRERRESAGGGRGGVAGLLQGLGVRDGQHLELREDFLHLAVGFLHGG
jgi:hypothetical protein